MDDPVQRRSDGRAVLVLDDDRDVRGLIHDIVVNFWERPCLCAASLDELIALGEQALGCDLAILDINLGPDRPSGVEAYEWLVDHGFHGRIAFLTGHARSHPAVARASSLQAVRVYQKPVTLEVLASVVEGER